VIERWQKFLDSLATKGGNLAVLCFFVIFLLLLTMWVLHRGTSTSQAATVLLATFSGFSGALLAALTGQQGGNRKTDGNGNGNGAPVPTGAGLRQIGGGN
jgi:hypothetical protein